MVQKGVWNLVRAIAMQVETIKYSAVNDTFQGANEVEPHIVAESADHPEESQAVR